MVELDGFSHDCGIAPVVPLPELEAQYRHGLRILAVRRVGGDKVAAQQGRQAEKLDMGSRHLDHPHVVGYVTARDRLAPKTRRQPHPRQHASGVTGESADQSAPRFHRGRRCP